MYQFIGCLRLWPKQKQPQDRVLRLLRSSYGVGSHSSGRGLGGRIKVSVKPKREPDGGRLHRSGSYRRERGDVKSIGAYGHGCVGEAVVAVVGGRRYTTRSNFLP